MDPALRRVYELMMGLGPITMNALKKEFDLESKYLRVVQGESLSRVDVHNTKNEALVPMMSVTVNDGMCHVKTIFDSN